MYMYIVTLPFYIISVKHAVQLRGPILLLFIYFTTMNGLHEEIVCISVSPRINIKGGGVH